MKPSKFVVVHMVQGNYGAGWDDLCGSDDRKEARQDLKDYRANDPAPTRLIRRRVLRTDFESGNW